MFITARGWRRGLNNRKIAQYDLRNYTSEKYSTEYNRPNIMHEADLTKLTFRVSIPRDSTMGGDYLFAIHFTATDLATLFWSMLKQNGLADLLSALLSRTTPPPSDPTE